MNKLFIFQKTVVKVIFGVPRRTNSDLLFCNLGILNLKGLYMYAIGFFMYRYVNEMLPELFCNLYTNVSNVHDHNTRGSSMNKLYVSFQSTSRGKKSFSYVGPETWNYILSKIDTDCSIGVFKKRLRELCKICITSHLLFLY